MSSTEKTVKRIYQLHKANRNYSETKYCTLGLLHDNWLHVNNENVCAFFHPEVAPIDQVLETFVTAILSLWDEIFDSCER